jgi:hypothetical protein
VRFHVHNVDGLIARLVNIGGAERQCGAIWRPGRVPVAVDSGFSIGYLLGRAAVCGNNVNPFWLSRNRGEEGNLLSVGRPMRHRHVQRRPSELEALAPIRRGSEQRSFGNGHVGNPFPVLREFKVGT